MKVLILLCGPARMAALSIFYSNGTTRMNRPDVARRVDTKRLKPVIADLRETLNLNFDPLANWGDDLSVIAHVHPQQQKQDW